MFKCLVLLQVSSSAHCHTATSPGRRPGPNGITSDETVPTIVGLPFTLPARVKTTNNQQILTHLLYNKCQQAFFEYKLSNQRLPIVYQCIHGNTGCINKVSK